MKTLVRAAAVFMILLSARPAAAQLGKIDFSKATAKVIPLRSNVSVLQVRVEDSYFNIGVLAGPDGYLLVDHPEAAAHALIQKTLDALGKRPVRFLINTHWHYDHVGGNEFYAPDTVIVAHENVRKRLMTEQRPWWSPTPIGPYPERAWPRVTFRDSLTIHFAGEDVELAYYGPAHTDGDTIVYFTRASIVQTGDVFHGHGNFAMGEDMPGLARMLSAVADRINDQTIIITGHGEMSNRREIREYVELLNDAIAQVKQGIAAGKTDEQIQAQGLPEKWKSWPAADNVPGIPQFLHLIFLSLTNKNTSM
jgi:glyoxylase-like metal-dependent hydrolase (beta-lactamase superfamily II)